MARAGVWLASGLLAGCLRPSSPEGASAAPAVAADAPGRPTLLRVQDGDSFVVRLPDGREARVRIAAIDAPERDQAGGEAARRGLQALLHAHALRLEGDKTDRYGRLVRTVFADDADVGLVMVTEGLAWHNRPWAHEQAPRDRQVYAQAERQARAARRGLWATGPDAIEPWRWRRERAAVNGTNPQPRPLPLD